MKKKSLLFILLLAVFAPFAMNAQNVMRSEKSITSSSKLEMKSTLKETAKVTPSNLRGDRALTTTVTASKITAKTATWTGSANETWDVSITISNTSGLNQNVTNGYAQFGTQRNYATKGTFSTSGISGTITSVAVDCASYQGNGTVSVTVGGAAFGSSQAIPSWSNNAGGTRTFTGSASGEIVVTMNNGSNTHRAMYIKSITVTYTACGAPESITISNTTPSSATMSWTGSADSYNLQYRESAEENILFFDDFENGSLEDNGWVTIRNGQGTTSTDWHLFDMSSMTDSNGNPAGIENHSGSYVVMGRSWASSAYGVDNWLISPEVTLDGTLKFWVLDDGEYHETYSVYVSTDTNDMDDFTLLYTPGNASDTWSEITVDLSSYNATKGYIAIRLQDYDKDYLSVDDFGIYQTVGTAGTWSDVISVNGTSYTFEGLDEGTNYEVQIQGVCTGTGVSDYVSASFSTLSYCSTPTSTVASNISASTAELSWEGFVDSYNVQYRTPASVETFFYDGFEDGIDNWTIYTDGEYLSDYGFEAGWFVYNASGLSGLTNHSGSYSAIACSWMSSALNADNWLITPQVELKGTLKFWVYSNYYDEYEVLLSTDTNNERDFTVTLESLTAAPAAWTEVVIDLSRYEGRGYIAIHHNFTDGQWLVVDDFGIYGDEIPAGSWESVENVTSPYTITGLAPETDYEWQVQGICSDGTTDWSDLVSFTTLSVCDAPADMSTTDITATSATLNWAESLDEYNVRYASVSYFESFENGMSDWTVVTDGEALSGMDGWFDFDPSLLFSSVSSHTGSYTAMSWSYDPFTDDGVALAADNWLISPQLDLEGFLKFWVTTNYTDEYEVLLSTTSNSTSDFTVTLQEMQEAEYGVWTEVSIDLSRYAGTQGYIAIHHVYTDGFVLFVDDFGIYTNDWENATTNTNSLALSDLNPETNYVWQVQGVDCDGNKTDTEWSAIESFTTDQATVLSFDVEGYDTDGGYVLVASPIYNVNPETAGMITDNYDLYRYNQSADLEWENYKNTEHQGNFILNPGAGYLYASKNGAHVTLTGDLYDGNGEVALAYDSQASMPGWNLIGNPFNASATLDMPYYKMNSTGTELEAETESPAVIAAFQGVFVEATGANQKATFTPATKAGRNNIAKVNIFVSDNNGKVIDNAIVRFDGGATLGKFQINPEHTKLYIPQNGNDYAVANVDAENEMPLNFKAETAGTYTISFNIDGANVGYLHLIDMFTGMDVNILSTPEYSFIGSSADAEGRFIVRFSETTANDTFVYQNGDELIVNGEGTLQVYDVTGRFIDSYEVNGSMSISASQFNNAVYIFRMIGNEVKTQKIVVR